MKKSLLLITLICLLLLTSLGKIIQAYLEVGIFLFALAILSGVVIWLLYGCRTSLSEEMSQNRGRNEIFGIVLILIMIALVIYINNR